MSDLNMGQPESFGRADEQGNVYVRVDGVERLVGQYPDATESEALAYFVRKFNDLEGQVRLLEQRVRSGAKAQSVKHTIDSLAESIRTANAVGDLASLASRLDALRTTADTLDEQQHEEAKEAVDAAVHEREAIVERIEALAAKDSKSIQWKSVSVQINAAFDEWKEHQRTSARIPKAVADALWQRFRGARNSLETSRRQFFAQLDETHKTARALKERLVERAEELASATAPSVSAYRSLLDEWKAAGRAGGKVDDLLWAKFKAAGDAVFAFKHGEDAKENEHSAANLKEKEALVEQAEALLPVKDPSHARQTLVKIQSQWDAVGRVPKENVRDVEGRLSKVERAVKSAEEAEWRRDNPETRDRVNSVVDQLQDSIAKLERQIAKAQADGDAGKAASLTEEVATKKSWLSAIH